MSAGSSGRLSAGILLWCRRGARIEVLLGHFGGPLWAKRDAGAWAIPKGLVEEGEDLEACARREFEEELGIRPEGPLTPLGRIHQKGGKYVEAFALQGNLDPATVSSNQFKMEWPPSSGLFQAFPEIDRACWFPLDKAAAKILPSQLELLQRLEAMIER